MNKLFSASQVSFFSTSPELSNKQRFEYFSRTIPSDHYQVKAMVEIVMRLGWSYISIIYEESNYGVKAFEELEELLAEHNICIAVKEKLVKDSGVAQERAYDTIVQKLLTKSRARGKLISVLIERFLVRHRWANNPILYPPPPSSNKKFQVFYDFYWFASFLRLVPHARLRQSVFWSLGSLMFLLSDTNEINLIA